MHIEYEEKTASYLIALQDILEHHSINTLTIEEITFLQLHYLERLEVAEIADMLDQNILQIETIALKFLPAIS